MLDPIITLLLLQLLRQNDEERQAPLADTLNPLPQPGVMPQSPLTGPLGNSQGPGGFLTEALSGSLRREGGDF